MGIKNNNTLWIYYNFKETADLLSKKEQKNFWYLVINYGFGDENIVENELKTTKKETKIAFLSIKNLLKLRKSGGSQNGKSNNPSGLSKDGLPNIGANEGANITPTPLKEKRKEEKESKDIKENIKEKDADATNSLIDRFVNRWNNGIAKNYGVPKIMILSDQRRYKLKSRIEQATKIYPELDEMDAIFKIIADAFGNSRFLRGEGPNNDFKFDVDFVLQEKTFIRMYEGKYNDKN